MNNSLYIGIMSGTSMDGVDTVVVDFSDEKLKIIAQYEYPFPQSLKEEILDLIHGEKVSVRKLGELDHRLGLLFAAAVNALLDNSHIQANTVCAIGNHGQTVFHQPNGQYPFSMQLGNAHLIARKTGIDTVADFRCKDVAFGGQGAPLVPAFHQNLLQTEDAVIVVLNIGGMANITVLQPKQTTIGYDTGPGNVLQDIWVQMNFGLSYDQNAQFARQGQLQSDLLYHFLQEPYFSLPAPKSTGRELFNQQWLQEKLNAYSYIEPADVQRSLLELTVQTIATEINCYMREDYPAHVYVCGGGSKNPLLMSRLKEVLSSWKISTTDSVGISADYMEAIAFAWLAYRHVNGLNGNLPAVTGASKATILGAFYPAQ